MKPPLYPFAAIFGQQEMKLALLLAAVDWRVSVLLRGDKGAGKTTAARGLAALLPEPAPFINLPIGATEDRLLGGLHLERALKGDPALKPGLLSEAHRGVLYVDEVNLLPGHLGDALLDAAASGVNVIEREGFSASHPAEFVLLGSMNPEEGSLRPQLLDRFALAVDIQAPLDPTDRQALVERRIAFERDPLHFASDWSEHQQHLREQVANARAQLTSITCSSEILAHISTAVCDKGVRSLRADLSAVRASIAYAALSGDTAVEPHHVATILPLVLAHRTRQGGRPPTPPPRQPPPPPPSEAPGQEANESMERIFTPRQIEAPQLQAHFEGEPARGVSAQTTNGNHGPVIGARRTETPNELDLRATLSHTLLANGNTQPRLSDLHERIRKPRTGTRFLFVIDSSGSHAAQERMRLVKGAATSLLDRSFKNGDEVALIVFRGPLAQVVLEPTTIVQDAKAALEYLPTGGRTPLAHALDLARNYITPSTILVLLTDGRANVPLHGGDPWKEALDVAPQLRANGLLIDTENDLQRVGQSRALAEALGVTYIELANLYDSDVLTLALQP
ncbi:ATP-binding protein [Granulicella sp. dw_53]|uniref:ATP-binding protein n=1 Tax=Granulicella sp. dw_53 TaxID=2719792 RepID=UPI001BD23D5A|nr:ATP-binding protein [Granulicella sp. dw_53]